MQFKNIQLPQHSAWAEVSSFSLREGVSEHHLMLHVHPLADGFCGQLARLLAAYDQLLQEQSDAFLCFQGQSVACQQAQEQPDACLQVQSLSLQPIMCRFFLSDIANQAPLLQESLQSHPLGQGAHSLIGQPPLDGSKLALWVYLANGLEVSRQSGLTVTHHHGYSHYWTTSLRSSSPGSASQTSDILEAYGAQLSRQGQTLADHCLRTWFYIRDVDTNYKGMVEARRSHFTQQHLTPDTHYIASTGIGGQPLEQACLVQMDAYSASGLQPSQQQYLYAPTHLNPTYEYGVTFERGTAIHYGDRSHLLISGTASIDNQGKIVHPGDIVGQTLRMLENVEALLAEADAHLQDVAQAIIYLRDLTDYPVVRSLFQTRLPHLPCVFTLAPVCRPGWLIEMECIAIVPHSDPTLAAY